MAKITNKRKEIQDKFDSDVTYKLDEASSIVKQITTTNFDSSVDMAIRLGVDPKNPNQMIIYDEMI